MPLKKLILLISFLFFLFWHSVYAQKYHFKNYKEFGFTQNQIFSILQDQNRFLWFGSGVGLSRYDSENFLHFTVEDGLPANEILSMTIDNQNRLWAGTGLGLAVFELSSTFKPKLIDVHRELSVYSITQLVVMGDKLYVGTRRNGLFLLDLSDPRFLIKKLTGEISIKDIIIDQEQNTAFVLHEFGFCHFGDGIKIDSMQIATKNRLKCMLKKRGDIFWIGTSNGIIEIDYKKKKQSVLKQAPELDYNCFLQKNDNIIWAGTDKGLVRFSDEIEIIDRSKGLPGHDIRALLYDHEGNLWIGSYTSGLFKFSDPDLINYSENNGLISNVVNAVMSESEGRKLVGTDQGIFKIEDYKLSRDKRFQNLNNEIIWFIYLDERGSIWTGGEDILYVLNGDKNKPFKIDPLKVETTFLDMMQDSKGRYWFGTTVGLYSVSADKHYEFPELKKHGIRAIWDIEELSDGRIFIGTDNGLVIYTVEEQFQFINQQKGLPDRAVYEIHEDKNKNIWLGSDLGLILMEKNGNFRLFDSENGLRGKIMSQILEDEHAGFWLCTDRGMQYFNNGKAEQWFGLKDGLVGEEFTTQNSSLIAEDGRFWLGLFGGLTIMNPYKNKHFEITPYIYLQEASYFQNVGEKKSLFSLENPIPYDNNNLFYKLLGVYYYNENDLNYLYKLEGFENEWSVANRGQVIRYSNLSPGDYSFQVKPVIEGNPIDSIFIAQSFFIDYPFWQKPLFFIFAIVFFVGSGYFIYYSKTQRITALNRELQSQIDKNVQQLELAKATIENIIENSGSILITTDHKGRITTWNKRAHEVFGFSKDFVLHKHLGFLDLEEDVFGFQSIVDGVIENGELRQIEARKKTKNGEIKDLIITATPLSDQQGKAGLISFNMEDFSERNRLTELRINREKLLAGIEALNNLLATLSHYINNSTAAISGMAQLAELNPKYNSQFHNVVNTQIKRIKAVIKSLSTLVEQLNLKTKDYVGEKDRLFDIEKEISEFLTSVEKIGREKETR